MKARISIIVLLLVCACALSAQTVYVPIPLKGNIKSVESTQLDIGTPEAIFDGSDSTIIRTPAINPAYVRVELVKPITFDYLRIMLIETEHRWSLATADSMADLVSKTGSYKLRFKDQFTANGHIEQKLNAPITARAFELNVLRLEGDDYVHVSELQFCMPKQAGALRVFQLTDRRDSSKLTEVTGKLTKPIHTVVVLKAKAATNGTEIDVSRAMEWKCVGDGIVPWGQNNGEFLIRKTGEHKLIANYGDIQRTFILEGTPRVLGNREPDIDVWFIERLPRIPFDGPNDGLPLEGSIVTWRAHVYNWGTDPIEVTYEWKLDGEVVKTGKKIIPVGPPGIVATPIDYKREWEESRQDLTFTVRQPIQELITANNTITVQTDAVTVGFWVEQSMWDYFHEHQHRLPTKDANSFAGWSQRMMRQWNKMFTEATYELCPEGIQERVRLDRLTIVPDFSLPLAGGLPSNNPDLRDKTIDMQWGHESVDIVPGIVFPESHWWSPEKAIKALNDGRVEQKKEDPPFWCGLGYIHEMGHARYLIDSYGFDIHSGPKDGETNAGIRVTDEKGSILGRYMPENAIVHYCRFPGNMGGDYFSYSIYEAMCWNRVLGKRARQGNCNAPGVIGEFLQEIPEKLIYQYIDNSGQLLAGADIWIYRSRGTGKDWYTKVYEDEPAIKAVTDKDGKVTFDRTMFSADGKLVHTYGFSNAVVLVRVTYKGQHYYMFEEVSEPNLAFNYGHKDEYVFKRQIKLRTGEPSLEEWDPRANWDLPGAGFDRR